MNNKSKGKKAKSRGEMSFFDKTLGKFDQKASRKKVSGIVLAVIMIVSISAGIAASSITDQNSYVESETVSDEDVVKAMSAEDLNLNIVPLSKTFKDPKMESVIAQIVDASETNPAEVQSFASAHDIGIVDGKIRVVLELTDEKASLEEGYDIEIEATYKNLVQALVPISAIKELAKDPAVQYMRLPLRAYPMITSEGVAVINADALHAMGIKGAGVKIAVIDGGFKNYTINPEIPAANIIEAKSFRADGDIEAGEEHGTACAEVVLDVAPDANIYLFNFETGVEFANAVDYAISKHVDIISLSWAWVNAGGYDGTGFLCDVVNNARDSGVLFVVAAGNAAEMHYEGTYSDTDGDKRHEFGPGDEFLDLGTLPAGTPITLFLSWNDWPTSNQDYDLLLLVKQDGVWYIAAISENLQTGTQPPTEAIIGETLVSAYWGVGITKYSATIDVHFELYSFTNNFPEYNVKSSSLTIPADAEGAMTAGATYWEDDSLESFSSQGPTNDGRTKPDGVAPDGVSSWVYGNFYGTSASAPHVGGAAALLFSACPPHTVNEIQSALEATAVDFGTTGKDNLYGAGRINVSAAYNYLCPGGIIAVSVSASPTSIVADGTSTSAITATVTSDGSPVSEKEVTFATTLGTVEPETSTTNENGIATSILTSVSSTTTVTATVTATADGVSDSTTIEFTGTANTTVSIDNASAAPTKTTTTTVMANNVTDLATFNIRVSYNQSVVIVTGATNNPDLGTNLNNLDDADEGWVRLANFNLVQAGEGLSGDVWISNLTLEAVGAAGDESTLAITINTLSNSTEGAIPATPVNGMFTVGSPYIPGDIMGDSDVDLDDATYLAKHVLEWEGYEVIYANGDIMCDGDVDLDDATYLAKHVLEWEGYEVIC